MCMIAEDDLSETDRAILTVLSEGARTKKAIVDATGLHRNTVGNRLEVLEAGGVVQCLHETTALYELASDPREDSIQKENEDETVDVEAVKRALDDIELYLDQGEPRRIEQAVKRARDALE